jgi:type I restriction enzyme M protein
MLLNASKKYQVLKKNKGAKRREINKESRFEIVETLAKFQDNDCARVFDKEFFYFNEQAISLTNVDKNGKALSERVKLSPVKLENGHRELTKFVLDVFDQQKYNSLYEYFELDTKPFIASLDYKEQPLVITTVTAKYWFDNEQETLIEESNGKKKDLGCGKIVVKASYKSATKRQGEHFEITVELTPDTEKDFEIIPFYKNEVQNRSAINAFMEKHVTKPFKYIENTVGVQMNFNKVFYKPEQLRDISCILKEIEQIESEIKTLEEGLDI